MKNQIIIGLEAHDATGKSETSKELLKIFGGEISTVSDDMKIKRRNICAPISVLNEFSNDEDCKDDYYNINQFLDACTKMDESYMEESQKISKIQSHFIVMDRTWASHAAERYYQSRYFSHTNPYLSEDENQIIWPEGVTKPNITFEIVLIPDEVRVNRMIQRSMEEGVEINERELKLNNDKNYRALLEFARRKLGCKRFVIREKRDEIVCALRISQTILGSFDCPPMDTNLEHLQS